MKSILSFIAYVISTFTIIIFTSSCNKDDSNRNTQNLGHILFQYDYVNWAWGYQHAGWFIDSSGNVKGYNLPHNWKYADSLGYILKDSLELNYNNTDTLLFQVEKQELLEKAKMIEKTINGKLSAKTHTAFDAGSAVLYCYYWDRKKGAYKIIFLAESGDFEQHNLDTSGIALSNWLISIMDKTNSFWFKNLGENR